MAAAARKALLRRTFHVLVVDDDLDQVHSLAYLLKDDGHTVDFAINATVALDLARKLKPEVVLLDIGLPDTNGMKVAGLMRLIPGMEQGKARIVAVTGRDIADQELLNAGFDGVARKPVQYLQLQAALEK